MLVFLVTDPSQAANQPGEGARAGGRRGGRGTGTGRGGGRGRVRGRPGPQNPASPQTQGAYTNACFLTQLCF